MRGRLAAARGDADGLGHRLALLLQAPVPRERDVAALAERWRHAGARRLDRAGHRLAVLEQSLAHLNPQAVLERGYAIVAAADGRIVHDAQQVAPGDDVALTFARGGAAARVTRRD
jgi:exodeoxyribonuclease VII large subunit